MDRLPIVPDRHYRMLFIRRGEVTLDDHAAALWQAQQALAEIHEVFAVLYGEDGIFQPLRCDSAEAIRHMLETRQLDWGDARLATDPTHDIWLGSPLPDDRYAALRSHLNLTATERTPSLVLESHLGSFVEEAEKPAALLRKLFVTLVDIFKPEWAVVEPPNWVEPSHVDMALPWIGWLTFTSEPWMLSANAPNRRFETVAHGKLLQAHQQLRAGDDDELRELVPILRAALRPELSSPPPATAAPIAPVPAAPVPVTPKPVPRRRSLEPVSALGGTQAARPGAEKVQPLPFAPASENAPPPPRSSSLEPHLAMGGTVGALAPQPALGAISKGSPSQHAPARQPSPSSVGPAALSLDHYARLCAALESNPAGRTAVLAHYGIADEATLSRIEAGYRKAFARDPQAYGQWAGLVVRYRQSQG